MNISFKEAYDRFKSTGVEEYKLDRIFKAWESHKYEESDNDSYAKANRERYPKCDCVSLQCTECGFEIVHFLNFTSVPDPSPIVIENIYEEVLTCEERIIKQII